MSNTAALQKVSEETMRFMRGKYALDEIGITNDKNAPLGGVKFRRGGKTVVTIYIYDDRFDFLVIFGKAEREKFEAQRNEFPQAIQDIYDNSKTYHDGKWMMIPVADLDTLEAVKKLILIKKKPNRKPFPKENAVYGNCGQRCDLCIHYTDSRLSKAFRLELHERFARVYKTDVKVFDADCNGCHNGGIGGKHDCPPGQCRAKKGFGSCRKDCSNYHSCMPAVSSRWSIEPRNLSADDVTWTIIPYAHEQYEN